MRITLLILSGLLSCAALKAQVPEMIIQEGHQANTPLASEELITSNDWNYFITYDAKGNFKLWDRFTGRLLRNFKVQLKDYMLAAMNYTLGFFSPPSLSSDNNYLLTEADNNPAGFSVWNINTGKIEMILDKNAWGEKVNYNLCSFTNNGSTLLTHGVNTVKNKYEIAAWSLKKTSLKTFNYSRPFRVGKKGLPANEHNPNWMAGIMATTADNDLFAIGTTDGRIFLFNTRKLPSFQTRDLQPDQQFIMDTTNILRLCFSNNGQFLTAATRAGTKIWNTANGKLVKNYTYPTYTMNYGDSKIRFEYGHLSEKCGCIALYNKLDTSGKDLDTKLQFLNTLTGSPLHEYRLDSLRDKQSFLLTDFTGNLHISEDGHLISRIVGDQITTYDLREHNIDSMFGRRIRMSQTTYLTNTLLDVRNNDLFIGRSFNDALIFNLTTGRSYTLKKFADQADTLNGQRSPIDFGNEFGPEVNVLLSEDGKYLCTFNLQPTYKNRAVIWDRERNIPVELIDDIPNYTTNPRAILSLSHNRAKWIKQFLPEESLYYVLLTSHTAEDQDKKENKKSTSCLEIWNARTQKMVRKVYPWGQSQPTADYSRHFTGNEVVTYSADKKFVFAGMQNGSVLQIELSSGKQIACLDQKSPFEVPTLFDPKYNPVMALNTDADGKNLYVCREDTLGHSFVTCYDIGTGRIVQTFRSHNKGMNSITIHPNNKLLITAGKDKKVKFWNITTGRELATLVLNERDFVITTPEGYYMASRKGAAMMHYVIEKNVYLFEQFDLRYNRPDLVLARLGLATAETLQNYKLAYLQRVQKAGYDPGSFEKEFTANAPVVKLTRRNHELQSKERNFHLTAVCEDRLYPVHTIQVRVNGVPVYGIQGINVAILKQQSVTRELDINLSAGRNLVEVSAINEKGVESLRQTIEVDYIGPHKQPTLYVVTLGLTKYRDARNNLKYAAKDAADIGSFFKNSTKEVKYYNYPDSMGTKQGWAQIRELLSKTDIDDRVILFYAGHGQYDTLQHYYLSTYEQDFGHPNRQGISFGEVEALLEAIPAREKIFFIDACFSGGIEKGESITGTERGRQQMARGNMPENKDILNNNNNVYELMRTSFVDLTKNSGTAIIAAARGVQYALEEDKRKNGLFTWCLLKGLREKEADDNKDGKIMLSELQLYLERMVMTLTNNTQRPTFRAENLVKDIQVL